MTRRQVISVDLDGVIASFKHGTFDEIGPPIPGAREFLSRLMEHADVIIVSCRCTEECYQPATARELRLKITDWLVANDMPFTSVWSGQGKPLAVAYIDDRAVACQPEFDSEAFDRAEKSAVEILNNYEMKVPQR